MGLGSFLKCWKKFKSLLKPTKVESSSSAQPKSNVKELEKVFRRFDVNGDGKISWKELGWVMSSLGQKETPEELKRMVGHVDSDGDGSVSLNEFIELNTEGVDSDIALEDIRSAFSLFDVDGKGFISHKELHTFLRKLGESTSMDECREMISLVDRDRDGVVNFEEFKLMMMGSS